MAVMPIHTPRAQYPLHVAVVPRSPDVIHHLIAPSLDKRGANFGGKGVQHFVPGRAFPLALATLTDTLQGIQDALRVMHLVDRRGTFGAVAPTTARMVGVALQLLDLPALFVH